MLTFFTWLVMRSAAMERHRLLVEAFYPPGPKRDLEMRFHEWIVRLVYGA